MRLDHIAYRVADRNKTADFFIKVFGYRIAEDLPEGFDIQFEDGTWAKCLVLLPPEKINSDFQKFVHSQNVIKGFWESQEQNKIEYHYHLAPEIFISDGSMGSIVKDWVDKRDGVGGIHHLAYQVASVEDKVKEMKDAGYLEFTTEEPIRCEGLTQIFTKPSQLTGIIYEFITRDKQGFCKDSVKDLMNSTKDAKHVNKILRDQVLLKFNVLNKNDRMYINDESFRLVLDNYKEKIKNGSSFGEIGHPINFDVSFNKVSHLVTDVKVEENLLIGDLIVVGSNDVQDKLLKMIENNEVVFRPRSIGIINEDKTVNVHEIFAFDAILKSEDAFDGLI